MKWHRTFQRRGGSLVRQVGLAQKKTFEQRLKEGEGRTGWMGREE